MTGLLGEGGRCRGCQAGDRGTGGWRGGPGGRALGWGNVGMVRGGDSGTSSQGADHPAATAGEPDGGVSELPGQLRSIQT